MGADNLISTGKNIYKKRSKNSSENLRQPGALIVGDEISVGITNEEKEQNL